MTPQQEVHRLWERFNQLGEKLPQDFDYLNDPDRVEEVIAIMTQMQTLDERADAILEQHREKPEPKPKHKHNIVMLEADKRYAGRVSKHKRALRQAAMQRMRRYRKRQKIGVSVLADVEIQNEVGLVELLVSLGFMHPCDRDHRERIAKAAGRFLDCAVRDEQGELENDYCPTRR